MSIKEISKLVITGLRFIQEVQKRAVQIIMSPADKKLRQKISSLQNWSIYIFVPAAGIAIFSDNGIFETIGFICGIIFAVTVYIEHQLG